MSAIKKLTGVGGDIRQIAALLQSKGRRGDTMLAHITPREAALLRSQGGAGTINPETGLPEFYEEFDFGSTDTYDTGSTDYQAGQTTYQPVSYDEPVSAETMSQAGQMPTQVTEPGEVVDRETMARAVQMGVSKPPPSRGFGDLASALKTARPFIPAIAATGAAGMGVAQSRKAQQQAEEYKRQQEQIAAPYRMRGQQMIGAAERGELTPVNRQTMEAVRAQLAQQVQGRGGVGAMQATEQIARLQQTLLQNQYDYGLKVANLGDQIAIGAIKTGMQADKQMRDLMQGYMTAAARIAGGSSKVLGSAKEEE